MNQDQETRVEVKVTPITEGILAQQVPRLPRAALTHKTILAPETEKITETLHLAMQL
jgi:hypothetical protein